MHKKYLKIAGITISSILSLIVVLMLLLKSLGPLYLIPFAIKQVEQETNGRYTLSVNSDSLKIRFITMSMRLGHTEFIRDSSVKAYSNIEFLDKFDVDVSFESLTISAFNLLSFAFSKELAVKQISLIKPSIVVRKNRNYNPALHEEFQESEINKDSIHVSMPHTIVADTLAWREFKESGALILPHLIVEKFKIKGASFSFYGGLTSYPIQEVSGLSVDLTGFQLLKQKDIEIEDVFIGIESVSSLTSKNTARITLLGVELRPRAFHIDSVHFGHIVDKYAINGLKGYRASWLNIAVKDIDLDGIHPNVLINDSLVLVNKIIIGKAYLNLFKDKEEPKINPAYKAMPQETIRSIPIGLKIDTLEILNADLIIDMQAPKANVPGQITLNQTSALIANITNIPGYLKKNPMMELHLSSIVLNQVPVQLEYKLNIESKDDEYWAKCKIDPFEASVMNDFLGSQFFLEFKTGHIDTFDFSFKGNNKVNVGEMDFEYTKLRLQKLKGYNTFIEGKPKTGFLSVVGNMLIPNNRSKKNKKYKPGAIYYEKEFNRPMIHGTIMSMLSGVLSSMGITSRNIEKQQQKADALDDTDIIKSEESVIKQSEKIDERKENEIEKEVKKGEKEAKKIENKEN